MLKKKIAVLISGNGSNLQALIDACKDENYPAEIVLVLSNKAGAYGIERAHIANIPTEIISHKDFEDRETFDKAMDKKIKEYGAELICMAGFMRLLSGWFVNEWFNKLINIHPSLLPKFKGLNTHQRALDEGETETGCTVHLARKEMDEGPIIVQRSIKINKNETAEELAKRVLIEEHKAYPEALALVASGKFIID
ncbi:phosphoribosylglycinamide formyltransferase [Rickettsiales bacterium]|nr:phosphoribosylglycinamide formyltransferase [Rickettsiales bacterium]